MPTRTEISFRLDVAVKHDEKANCFVSYCPAVDVYSAGKSEGEAKEAIRSALLMFIRNCWKRKILDNYLCDRGFVADSDEIDTRAPVRDEESQYIDVQLREFGGTQFPVTISLPLSFGAHQPCLQYAARRQGRTA